MFFEQSDGKVSPDWCKHIDLIGKQQLTDWFTFQREELEERYSQVAGYDGTKEEMKEWYRDSEELESWRKEFIKIGFIFDSKKDLRGKEREQIETLCGYSKQ